MSPRHVHFIVQLKTTDIKTHDINIPKFVIKLLLSQHTHAHTHTHTHTHTHARAHIYIYTERERQRQREREIYLRQAGDSWKC